MSKKAKKTNQDKIAAKKATVLDTQKRNRLPLAVAFVGIIVVAAVVVFYVIKGGQNPSGTANGPVIVDDTRAIFPVALFEDGQAHHFEYMNGKHTIRYFILKSSDGILRAAFDACDVCWPAGKGYYQEGDHMVCRNCGRRFASVRINEVKGGCNPAPLNRKLENDKLIIRIKDIQQGSQYFNFDGDI